MPVRNSWLKPTVIYDSGRQPALSIDNQDNLHLMFRDQNKNNKVYSDIYYTFFIEDIWTKPINISNSKKYSINPNIVIDTDNIIHAFWEEICKLPSGLCPPSLFYSYCKDGNWSKPKNIYQSSDTTFSIGFSSPALNNKKQCYVMWANDLEAKYLRLEKGKPSKIQKIQRGCMIPNIYIDKKDNIHLSYIGVLKKKSIKRSKNDIFYIYSKSEDVWSRPVLVFHDKDNYSHNPKIITDTFGRINIVWLQDESSDVLPDDVYHSFSNDGVNWSNARNISNSRGNCHHQSIAMDSRNILHVVWDQSNDKSIRTDHIWYSFFNYKCWSLPYRITPPGKKMGSFPTIAVDNKDKIHVIWVGKLIEGGEKKLLYSATRSTKRSSNYVY